MGAFQTAEMERDLGLWVDPQTAPPVDPSDIRRWAIATWWPAPPPRLHWDEDYARKTRWGGVIAPAGFNPFAWPVERKSPRWLAYAEDPSRSGRLVGLNRGQVETYGSPIRSGDVISSRTRLEAMSEREGRFGPMLYFNIEVEWTNDRAEFVRRRLSTVIRYWAAA